MALTDFASIVTLAKQRVNFIDVDPQIDSIIKAGINQSYLEIAKNEEPLVKTVQANIENGMLQLPPDLMDVISIAPTLASGAIKTGRTILTSSTGQVTITYSYSPAPLIADIDIPEISNKYWYLLSTYGCYTYWLFKKKEQEAQTYLAEYISGIKVFRQSRPINSKRRSRYADMLGV